MSADVLNIQLKKSEALFLLLSAKLNQEFLDSLQIEHIEISNKDMGSLIQRLEQLVGHAYAELADEVLEELINSFLPEIPIRNAGLADYSFPMYSIDETLPQIETAVGSKQVLEVEYYSMDREEVNKRQIEPYFVEKRYNYYIVMAYCRWREDIRLFRVDRIKSLRALDEHFEMPEDFEAQNYRNDEHI